MNIAEWADPPADKTGSFGRNSVAFLYTDEAEELREFPGRWGVLRDPDFDWRNQTQASGVAHGINTGKYAAFRPAGSFEACTRMVNGEAKLFVRYVGDEVSE